MTKLICDVCEKEVQSFINIKENKTYRSIIYRQDDKEVIADITFGGFKSAWIDICENCILDKISKITNFIKEK